MILTLVNNDTYDYTDPTHSVILEKKCDYLPAVGDLIKDGHSRSSFTVYRVERRVFRSTPTRSGQSTEFTKVYLAVSVLASY